MRRIFILLVLVCLGCSLGEEGSNDPTPCTTHADCPATQFCLDGFCGTSQCMEDADCPEGYTCTQNGCKKGVKVCETDEECPAGKSCIDYDCVGTDCSSGATQACVIGCHEGVKTCESGTWSACDAPPVRAGEVCDNGVDDDCNGETDEQCVQCHPDDPPQPCATLCGEGFSHCDKGLWGECDAPTDCQCEEPGAVDEVACGLCGTQSRTCVASEEDPLSYVWGDFGPCTSEGFCEPGQVEETDCGFMCGYQERECLDNCTWSEWSECLGEGMCQPGATEDKACGNCGIQTRACGEDCYWAPWGECQEDAGCKLGDMETKPCGNCGTMTRYCEVNCMWGDWGSCQDEGICKPGEKESQNCGYCGFKERTCTNQCTWGNYGTCINAGQCEPGDTKSQSCGPSTSLGVCEKGTQQKTCNASCQWNSWGSCYGATYPQSEICGDGIDQDCNGSDQKNPDQYEPNNSCSDCYWIDGDDPVVTLHPTFDSVGANAGGHDTNDYFCFKSVDNFNVWPTAEHIKVSLTGQPAGIDGDLFLYKGLSDCNAGNHIASSVTVGGSDESINWEETGDSDDGIYYVRIENWSEKAACYSSFTLDIQGLK